MLTLSRDVRIAATGGIVEAAELGSEAGDVGWDDAGLVTRTREVVGEAPSGSKIVSRVEGGNFRIEVLGRAYRGDIGAAVRERRQEHGGVLAIVGDAFAAGADAIIATSTKECNASSTKLSELVADRLSIRQGNSLLVVAIGRADDLRDVILGEDILKPG